MKKLNYPLILGGLLFLILMFAYLSPESFTNKDPMFEESHRTIEMVVDGERKEVFTMHPIFPNKDNLMGTDDAGRDIYARIIYGTRNTMKVGFMIALFRLIMAIPLGILAGMGKKFFEKTLLFFSTYFTAVPILIISYLIFRLNFFRSLPMDVSIFWFSLILGILGFYKAGVIISDAVKRIMDEDFIEGQIAIGKTWPEIIRQNIFPHVMPVAISTFFKEAAQGLFLIAQLSVLGIFVGTIREVKAMAFRSGYEMSLEPEWGSMLLNITKDVQRMQNQWWMVVFPVGIFTVAVLSMNLLGEGLRMEFMKRNSRFVSYMRKAFYVLSPRVLFSEIKHFKEYWKPVMIKFAVAAGILLFFFIPRYHAMGDFQVEKAMEHLEILSGPQFEGRVSGSEGHHLAGEYIKEHMMKLGFTIIEQPMMYAFKREDLAGNIGYSEEETIVLPGQEQEYALAEGVPLILKDATVTLRDDEGKEEVFTVHEDFSILSLPMEGRLPGEEITIKGISFQGDEGYEGDADQLIPVNTTGVDDLVLGFSGWGASMPEGKEAVAMFLSVNGHESRSNTYTGPMLTVLPFGKLAKRIATGYHEVTITYTIPSYPMYSGRTIEAWLMPEGRTMEDQGEVLIIGVPYDGIYLKEGGSSYEGTVPVAMALELARALTEGDRGYEKPILFLFFDKETDSILPSYFRGSGNYYMRRTEISANGGYSYLELMGTGLKGNKTVDLVAYFGQVNKEDSFRSVLQMEKSLKDMKVPYLRTQNLLPTEGVIRSRGVLITTSPSLLEFRANAHIAIGVGSAYKNAMGTKEDTLKNVNVKKLKRTGIMLTDLLISKEYFRLGVD